MALPSPTSPDDCYANQKDPLKAITVIARPQAVAISWYGVPLCTLFQEIATGLRPRNDRGEWKLVLVCKYRS